MGISRHLCVSRMKAKRDVCFKSASIRDRLILKTVSPVSFSMYPSQVLGASRIFHREFDK